MPLRGSNHSDNVHDEAPYFRTLDELDQWAERPSAKLNRVLDYHPRRQVEGLSSEHRGKLLVCHDYKGGYTEAPSGLAYTFNFWSYTDTFVYFSHHRVTAPPSGWTNAAHRHGVKILGTLIFESAGNGQEDSLRLLVGRLPNTPTGPAAPSSDTSLPLSPYYARLLAKLAYQRGFDGYLLNFECPLVGKVEQARALAAWISILDSELRRLVGPHSQVIWYDSVVITGALRWQDRLNNYNLPFFVPSSGFFTNYTWPAPYPALTAQYFLSLDPALMVRPKQLQDIFVGVDVWGRGQHGGGGLGSYRAISHIDPEFLGLSVALFGQAWTWETEQDKPGFNWQSWWEYEQKLWVGPPNEGDVVEVSPATYRQGDSECSHGPFVPMSSFFPRTPPPNPADLPFFTSFSPGVGLAWFVCGVKVLETDAGWTDIDKNTSLGDMVWPRPSLKWEHGGEVEALPKASTSLCMKDAWIGGSSLKISLSVPGSASEDAFFPCLWLPVQSLAITPHRRYAMSVVYKIDSDRALDFDVGLSMKVLGDAAIEFKVTPMLYQDGNDLPHGWVGQAIEFVLPCDHPTDVLTAAGLVIGFALEDPSLPVDASVRLGALSLYASATAPELPVHRAKILWVNHERASIGESSTPFAGTLHWDIAASLPPLTNAIIPTDGEDPNPLWKLDTSFPSFVYFNIYAQAHSASGSVSTPDAAVFIGSTGLDGRYNCFFIDSACLPSTLDEAATARFYVQGVTDHGHVLDWDRCAFVDVKAIRD